MDKAARILRAFTGECLRHYFFAAYVQGPRKPVIQADGGTSSLIAHLPPIHPSSSPLLLARPAPVDGVATTEEVQTDDGKGKKEKKSLKVLRKIPPQIIQEARGLAIFTSMRTGIAPFGGAGGTGVVVAKLPDGSWSAPAGFMPQNMSTGLMFGVDVYDCVLVIRTQEALEGFFTHKATLGTDIAVVAGPLGAGAAMETGMVSFTTGRRSISFNMSFISSIFFSLTRLSITTPLGGHTLNP